MQSNTPTIQNDGIDLRELWATLVKRKLTIIAVSTITTIAAAFYSWNIAQVYSGEVLIEVGEVVNNNQPTTIFNLDNINNLKEVTIKKTGLNADIPSGTSNILRISSENSDLSAIKPQLQKAVDFIIERHEQKAKLYGMPDSKIRTTQVVGEISVSEQPIKPKKQLIVAVGFIGGLILGIFLAFFMEFISNGRKVDEIPEMNKE